jgi:hypothetical protein
MDGLCVVRICECVIGRSSRIDSGKGLDPMNTTGDALACTLLRLLKIWTEQ